MNELPEIIEKAFENKDTLSPQTADPKIAGAINQVIDGLDSGKYQVAQKVNNIWQVNEWIKKAVLLSFRITDNITINGAFTQFYDKVPNKFINYTPEQFAQAGIRIVPPATVRRGAYLAPGVILMPSFVNIGAYVGNNTMVDSWVTVGSCAQIGKNVHLSANVMIGGVLEPLQSRPTIIEDNCFIGAGSEIAEGFIVEEGAVISMGVSLGQSTRIYNRQTKEITYGKVPPYSVVVSGSLPARDGSHSLYCAVIVKQVDETTRAKVGLNELLREIQEAG